MLLDVREAARSIHCIDAQISLARPHRPKPSIWTPIAFFAISIKGWELRFLFESSGRQVEKVAQLPELLFAIGGPEIDTTIVDSTAETLEKTGLFMHRVGIDCYRIHHQATLRKVVSDLRTSLDEKTEIIPAMRKLVEGEFDRGASCRSLGALAQSSPQTLIHLEHDWVKDTIKV